MRVSRYVLTVLTIVILSMPAWSQAVRIDIAGGVDRRVPVAVPDFAAAPGLEAIAREMTEVVVQDLAFTGLCRILPRNAYPASFTGFTADPAGIDFGRWEATKIDFLVYAHVTEDPNAIMAECRMFDVGTATQVVGKRFTTSRTVPRLIAHRFSEEIIRCIDGIAGIGSSQVCFSAGKSGNKEICVADYDGANARQVTRHNSISIKPKFSPDGAKIAYLSFKDRYPFLYILDLATGTSTPFSKNVGLNAAPAWAPDGQSLALVLSKDANTEIYARNIDGTGERRLTNNRAGDTSPTFAPDGKQIAFVSDRAGKPQIFCMNADGSNLRRLSYQGGSAYDPAWSPNGRLIAYVVSKSGEGFEIYVMDSDGRNPRRLTDSAGTNESPSWSADSRHVVFGSTRSGRSELWAVNVEPPHEQHYLPMGDLRCEGPSWGPRR